MYAVIRSGGKQYRVAPGETVKVGIAAGQIGRQYYFWRSSGREHGRK